MAHITISGFYPEPNPDGSLQFDRDVPPALETATLAIMGWTTLKDVPMGETKLTPEQAAAVLSVLNEPFTDKLEYSLGLSR